VVEPSPGPDVVTSREIGVGRDAVELLAIGSVGGGALVAVRAAVGIAGGAIALQVAGRGGRTSANDAVDHLPFAWVTARGLAPGKREEGDLARAAPVDGGPREMQGNAVTGLNHGRIATCVVCGGSHLAWKRNGAASVYAKRRGDNRGGIVGGR
jgi:hypothetical protein